MGISDRLNEEKMDLTCSECGEEFPEYLRNTLIAKGLREAARLISVNHGLWDDNIRGIVQDIEDRAKELEGPHGEFLS
jgi:hypothetical protein